ncbi:cercosporin toxin biosynthesis protein, partial [Teratosphaeria destructans]
WAPPTPPPPPRAPAPPPSAPHNVRCRRCLDGGQKAGFDPQFGIKVCANEVRGRGQLEDTLAHEMMHAYDFLRFKLDPLDLRHAACMEIRASMLSGECRFLREFVSRGQWGVTQQLQECVRRRAALSVRARPACGGDDVKAVRVVNEVWDSCFADTRPFDEIYRSLASLLTNPGIVISPLAIRRCVMTGVSSNGASPTRNSYVHLLRVPIVTVARGGRRRRRLDHLRREVIQRAAHGVAPVVGRVHRPAEIGDLDLAVQADEDVLGLDVAVHDVLAVQVAQRARHLRDVLRGLPLREALGLAQVLVQLALARELEDQEDALGVVEVAVQAQDVGVREVGLDLDLASDLLLHFAGLQLGFVQDFEGADEVRGAFARQVDPAEFAFAQGFADLEHAQVELFRRGGLRGEGGGGGAGFGAGALGGGLGGEGDLGGDGFGGSGGGGAGGVGGEFLEGEFDAGLGGSCGGAGAGGSAEVADGDGGAEGALGTTSSSSAAASGGLALANGLKQRSIPFHVFERDHHHDDRAQGYRLRIAGQADAALQHLLSDQAWRHFELTCGETRLRPIPEIDAETAEVRVAERPEPDGPPPPKPYTADRTLLREVLRRGLDADDISYGKRFQHYHVSPSGTVTAHFDDGSAAHGALLIGADGKNSPVRKQYLPDHNPLDTGGRCIYGKTPLTPETRPLLNPELLDGMGAVKDRSRDTLLTTILEAVTFPHRPQMQEAGFDCPPDYIYWVMSTQPATLGLPPQEDPPISNDRAEAIALSLTETWDPSLRPLIALQQPGHTQILPIDAVAADLPLWDPTPHIALLGDAVHLMGPTAGSGAITALRDCHVLLQRLLQAGFPEYDGSETSVQGLKDAVGGYEAQMREYAGRAIGLSWEAGRAIFGQTRDEDRNIGEVMMSVRERRK